MVGKDGVSQKTYSYTDYGETTEQGENDFYNEVCYGGGIYDKTTGLYYLNARYYSPENGSFLTQDTYRGSRSKTETLNLYGYCAGNPISYTDPSGHWVWGVVGAAMGAYDGYKYAKKKGYKGWKKYAAIAGGAALGVVNPFKVFKVARTGYKTYKAVKYSKKARAAYKATKVTKKAKAKPKHTVVMKKNTKAKIQSKPAVRNSKGIKKLQKSAGGTIGCFTAGTKIHTKDGFKAIENIKAGDYVWSENPETHEKALKKVKKIFVREKDSVVRLSINGEAIETTNEHPFYVEGHGWTSAYDLKVGDKVRLEDGTTGTVEKAKHVALDTPVTVYNFEVEDFHTYYVSEQKVLVHNTCAATAKNTQVAKSSNQTLKGTSVNSKNIRFSQSSVNDAKEIIESMTQKGWDGDPIDVVRMTDGKLTTLDNTRLLAAKTVGIDVQANIHLFDEILPEHLVPRFTTAKGVPKTWGDAVKLRIGKQNKGYRERYPFGSNIIGWKGN